jgi:hypothetical protein
MEVSGQLHASGKNPWCPLDRRLGGHQSRSGRRGEEKNSQPLPGLELPIIQPVVQRCTTELFRLLEELYRVGLMETEIALNGFPWISVLTEDFKFFIVIVNYITLPEMLKFQCP